MAAADLYGWFPMPNRVSQSPQQGLVPAGWQGGALSDLAKNLAATAPRSTPFGSGGLLGSGAAIGVDPNASGPSSGLMSQNGIIGGEDNKRFSSAAQGALAGFKYGNWPGAIIGGAIGYGAAGGVKDANPIDASGFSGIGMQQAWKDQNLARLASNPGASVASKLASAVGVDENSFHGKALQAGLDPAAFLGGLFGGSGGSHKRNWNAFNQAFPGTTVNDQGNYVLPEQFGGAVVNQKQLDDLAGTWYGATYAPDGDQQGWQEKYNNVLSDVLSQPMYNDFGGQP